MSAFSGNFCLDDVKKLMPMITTTEVPNDRTKIRDKDVFQNSEVNKDATFSVINLRQVKGILELQILKDTY